MHGHQNIKIMGSITFINQEIQTDYSFIVDHNSMAAYLTDCEDGDSENDW